MSSATIACTLKADFFAGGVTSGRPKRAEHCAHAANTCTFFVDLFLLRNLLWINQEFR
jgi:hypothetical protein